MITQIIWLEKYKGQQNVLKRYKGNDVNNKYDLVLYNDYY